MNSCRLRGTGFQAATQPMRATALEITNKTAIIL